MKLTAIEKMLFAHLDESDDSSDEQNETIGGQNKVGGSVREEGLHADSNENSSVRGAPANSVVNGGRPQRKTKSKNEIWCRDKEWDPLLIFREKTGESINSFHNLAYDNW